MAVVHIVSSIFVMFASIQDCRWAFYSLSDGFEVDEAKDSVKLLAALCDSNRIE